MTNDIGAYGHLQADGVIAWQTIVCYHCKHSWTDEYKLVGYSNLKSDEETT